MKLLTRDEFRKSVFERDKYSCVYCAATGVKIDAHHLIERRLWPDGGYYTDNGATLCESCHLMAEQTLISCEDLRERCKITRLMLPEHLYRDQIYDKWANPILPNGQRLEGELFDDPSVQKVLASVLHLFTSHVKYPRTYHLSWSPGVTKDDRVLHDLSALVETEVVVTLKMDGENSTFYNDGLHARSLSYEPHPSRNRLRALHAQIAADIPDGMRVCGENLFAMHSIHYQNLADYFLVFSTWRKNVCLSWDETCEWTELLGLKTVPVLYRGPWDEKLIRELHIEERDGDTCEGYVVRTAGEFTYGQFRTHAAKFVRAQHVQTHGHWMRQVMTPNELKK